VCGGGEKTEAGKGRKRNEEMEGRKSGKEGRKEVRGMKRRVVHCNATPTHAPERLMGFWQENAVLGFAIPPNVRLERGAQRWPGRHTDMAWQAWRDDCRLQPLYFDLPLSNSSLANPPYLDSSL